MAYVHPSPPSPRAAFSALASFDREGRSSRVAGMAFVVAIHVVLLVAIWHLTPARQVLTHAAPVIVRLLKPDPPAPPERKPPPPPPKVAKLKPVEPPPVQTYVPPIEPVVPIATPTSPITTVPEPPPPAPPVQIAVPPTPSAPAAVATPPRFDADYLRNPAPVYPAIARRNGEQGRVLVRVLVAPDGSAKEVELKTSSGHERLDQAALEVVRQWRFVPARLGNEAVSAWVVVPIAFTLGR